MQGPFARDHGVITIPWRRLPSCTRSLVKSLLLLQSFELSMINLSNSLHLSSMAVLIDLKLDSFLIQRLRISPPALRCLIFNILANVSLKTSNEVLNNVHL